MVSTRADTVCPAGKQRTSPVMLGMVGAVRQVALKPWVKVTVREPPRTFTLVRDDPDPSPIDCAPDPLKSRSPPLVLMAPTDVTAMLPSTVRGLPSPEYVPNSTVNEPRTVMGPYALESPSMVRL